MNDIFTRDDLIRLAKEGYDEHWIAKQLGLTYEDIKGEISKYFGSRAKDLQNPTIKDETLQRLLDMYLLNLSQIAETMASIPSVDWRVKAKFIELKTIVLNSLFKVLSETNLLPTVEKEKKSISGWEQLALAARGRHLKLTQTIEVDGNGDKESQPELVEVTDGD